MAEQFTSEFIFGHLNYWFFVLLMMTGLYIVIAKGNLVKKIVGLNIFSSTFLRRIQFFFQILKIFREN